MRALHPLGWLKTFHAFHEADVALADEVKERQAKTFVVSRNFYHQPQVGFDHLLPRVCISSLNTCGERNFLLRRKQFYLAYLT